MDSGQDILKSGIHMTGKVIQEAEHVAEGDISPEDAGRLTQDAMQGVAEISSWGKALGDRQWEREF